MITIYMITGPEKGRTFSFEKETVTVGRSLENKLPIKDKSVSRKHLEIRQEDDRITVTDLRSTNGTFINNQPLDPERPYDCEEWGIIRAGNVVMSLGEPDYEEVLSRHEAVDIQNGLGDTGLFNRMGTSPKNLELIYKVTSALMESLDVGTILEKVLNAIFDLLKRIDRGAIILLDSETGAIEKVISKTTSKYENQTKVYSETIVERVIRERKGLSFRDTRSEENLDPSKSMVLMNIRSVMCVPLISRSQVRGVIYVDSVNKPFGFRKEDLSLLAALSGPAAIAIENALLYYNAEKLVEERTKSLRETENRLLESEARFKAIFDNMNSGVGVYKSVDAGADFVLLDLNRAHQKLEGKEKDQLIGKPISFTGSDYANNGLLDAFRRVWESAHPEHFSLTFKQPEGSQHWREYDIYRLPSKEIVAIVDDITDRKKTEEEQKALQKQLIVSQKMESIGAFAGGTAHNFRNILQAVSGNVEYLEMVCGGNPEVEELAKSIYDSVEKGVDLINSLLHFSRRADGYKISEVEFGDVILKTLEIIRRVFDKNIEIRVNVEPGLHISGNASLLSQVFMNLFTNARDAMPRGGVLSIEARRAGEKVMARVSDTGHGMNAETMEKIFDPFFTLKDVGKGTGLGLSTTHGIIEKHGGTIKVSSEIGKGATFEILLPLGLGATQRKEESRKMIKPGHGQKILIVDDERLALDALAQLTNSLGYQAISFDKPKEALKHYRSLSPDLVLMDRSMPEMDGLACIDEILKTDRNARIIIVSGYEESGPDGIDGDIKSRIKGYLTKPCSLEELSDTIARVLRN